MAVEKDETVVMAAAAAPIVTVTDLSEEVISFNLLCVDMEIE